MKSLAFVSAIAMSAIAGNSIVLADSTSQTIRWTLQDVDFDGCDTVAVEDLNNNGEMTGYTTEPGESGWIFRAFTWLDQTFTQYQDVISSRGMLINDAGVAVGYSNVPDRLVRYSSAGSEEIAFPNSGLSSPFFTKINEAGMFCGKVNGLLYRWSEEEGLKYLYPSENGTANDMNEAGDVVGHVSSPNRAFVYRNGMFMNYGESMQGLTSATSIDDSGQVVITQNISNTSWSVHLLDLNTSVMDLVVEFPSTGSLGFTQSNAKANNSGMIAISWPEDLLDDEIHDIAHLGVWTEETGLVEIETPVEFVFIDMVAINESGLVLGRALTSHYESSYFVASTELGFLEIGEHIIGHGVEEQNTFWFQVIDLNDSGQVALKITEGTNLHHSGLLTPARAGDVDGDGSVNVTDLLGVIAGWGDWPLGSTCGPDLNMDGKVNVTDLLICLGDWG